MFYGKKIIVSVVVIMMVMCLYVQYSYSEEKPSEEVMKGIIYKGGLPNFESLGQHYSNINFIEFNITNTFFSNKNNRYCIEVNYIISFFSTILGGLDKVIENNKRYSFEKKGNKWYGWKGWGPGEE